MTLNSFTIRRSGHWANKKVLVDFGDQLGIDGMTVDTAGNIYAAVRSAERFGIVIFSSKGTELGYIETPELPTNVSFGRGAESSRAIHNRWQRVLQDTYQSNWLSPRDR